ncbi:hypothetical protein HAX54_048225 [Datura stramonium]|uniref:Uncharacterized protein n=1 Tax=Datura stramonium TaxID=4076 RepID=A0ABS8SU28_DATST|nr:hypothetical protein [Datura stramonium]
MGEVEGLLLVAAPPFSPFDFPFRLSPKSLPSSCGEPCWVSVLVPAVVLQEAAVRRAVGVVEETFGNLNVEGFQHLRHLRYNADRVVGELSSVLQAVFDGGFVLRLVDGIEAYTLVE